MARWTDEISLDEPLLELARRATGGLVGKLSGRGSMEGTSEFDLATAEERLGRPIPTDLRQFLAKVSPEDWEKAHRKSENGVRLYAPDELFWMRPQDDQDKHVWAGNVCGSEVDSPWAQSNFLAFAGDDGFNYMCVCVDPPADREGNPRRSGTIVWADHEWDYPVRVMAASLAQWLDRYIACGMMEPAVYPGNDIKAPFQTQLNYFEHYVRLNPHDEWGRERRARLLLTRHPPKVDEVHVYDKPSGTMRPISECVDLEELHLDKDQARSLRPLRTLAKLREMWLEIGEDSDLSPLASLRSLEKLVLRGEDLDLTPLRELEKLDWVGLDDSSVESFAPLADCRSLRLLQINRVRCKNWSTIASLKQAQRIHADSVEIGSLENFADMPRLIQLAVDRSKVSSMAPLSRLPAITDLGLSETRVSDLWPLAGLLTLTTLGLAKTAIVSLEPIRSLIRVSKLSIENTRVASIDPLAGMSLLEDLEISRTLVSSLDPLAGMTRLRRISAYRAPIKDLAPLSSSPELQEVWVDECPVESLRPLFDSRKLQYVGCRGTRVPMDDVYELRERHPEATIYADDED